MLSISLLDSMSVFKKKEKNPYHLSRISSSLSRMNFSHTDIEGTADTIHSTAWGDIFQYIHAGNNCS